MLAVIILAAALTLICCYCILKKRGLICKKDQLDRQIRSPRHDPHMVANDSTAKKGRRKVD